MTLSQHITDIKYTVSMELLVAPVEHITFDIEVGFIEIMTELFDVNQKI